MADPHPDGDTGEDDRARHDGEVPPGTPRWVKVLGIVFVVLVLLIVILHLTGNSLGGHAP